MKCKYLKFTCYAKEARCSNGTDKWPFFSILKGIASPCPAIGAIVGGAILGYGGENGLLNMANMSDYYFT